jgi:pimeloyl-ACP methyl ester carboxylesterase
VGVRTVGDDAVSRELAVNAVDDGRLSSGSLQLLAYLDLADLYAADPKQTLAAVHERAETDGSGDPVLLAAELSYQIAAREGSRTHYLGAAVYAYQYLFGEYEVGRSNAFSARFHLACRIYNEGLARAFIGPDGEFELGQGVLELPIGSIRLERDRSAFPWDSEQFPTLVSAHRYRLRGLDVRVRVEGLGVPLVALPPRPGNGDAPRYVPVTAVPAAAFLRVAGGVEATRSGLQGELELHSGYSDPQVDVDGRAVPLQVDLSTPLAVSAEAPGPWIQAFTDFLGWTEPLQLGLHLFQPYERGKIPVVFIHGTASAPVRWTGMFNGLQADERLRTSYQIWFFKYSSGNPPPFSAVQLRRALSQARRDLDPQGTDPALDRMVLVGHSQGGIIAKLLAVDSGDALWDAVATVPIDEFPAEPYRELLREAFVVEAEPHVASIVYMATPHRGSFLAGKWYSQLLAGRVRLEPDIRTMEADLLADPSVWRAGVFPRERIESSLDTLSEDHPFLLALDELPPAPGVCTHSIVAVYGSGPVEDGDDRLVTYRSAHREDVDSELVIRSSHGCQSHPDAVREVRRILRGHLEQEAGDGDGNGAGTP